MMSEAKKYVGRTREAQSRGAIRGDRMRPGFDFDEMRRISLMPFQAVRRLLIASSVAGGHVMQSLDILRL